MVLMFPYIFSGLLSSLWSVVSWTLLDGLPFSYLPFGLLFRIRKYLDQNKTESPGTLTFFLAILSCEQRGFPGPGLTAQPLPSARVHASPSLRDIAPPDKLENRPRRSVFQSKCFQRNKSFLNKNKGHLFYKEKAIRLTPIFIFLTFYKYEFGEISKHESGFPFLSAEGVGGNNKQNP